MLNQIDTVVQRIGDLLWGWPLIGFIAGTGIVFTLALGFIQIRYFTTAWGYLLQPEPGHKGAEISPLQAFMNTLSASVGNGSLAGMATAIYAGGPGAAFWVFLLGLISMPIRFAEVFCGTSVTARLSDGSVRGGTMAYIQQAPGGSFLVYIYMICCLWLTFFSGCAMQCQTMTGGLVQVTGFPAYLFAFLLFALVLYIVSGGSQRIMRLSDFIVPIKVIIFFIATAIAIIFHANSIVATVQLIITYAFGKQAISAGLLGYTMQNAIRFGVSRVSNATETGLGTAGILYGATGSTHPMRSGLMSMITTFTSNLLVCFSLMFLIVMSGAWQSGLNGIAMTVAAYTTVFGFWGATIVTIMSLMFGLGVLVAYAFIGRECWSFLTNGRYLTLYAILYCAFALFGSLANVALIWNSIDIANAGLILINLYALWMMLPKMRAAVAAYRTTASRK